MGVWWGLTGAVTLLHQLHVRCVVSTEEMAPKKIPPRLGGAWGHQLVTSALGPFLSPYNL